MIEHEAQPEPENVEPVLLGQVLPPKDEAQAPEPEPPARWGHALGPKLVLIGWSAWLMGSWLATLPLGPPSKAARWMVFASLAGLMLVYPVYRLSQRAPGMWIKRGADQDPDVPARHPWLVWLVLLDVVSMLIVWQAVVWPLMLAARWSVAQTLWLNLTVCAWGMLAGALTAMGCHATRGLPRTLTAALMVVLILGEPLLAMILVPGEQLLQAGWPTWNLSPLPGVSALSGNEEPELSIWAARALGTLLAAGVAWVAVAWWSQRRNSP